MRRLIKGLTVLGIIVGALSLQACRVRSGVVIGDGYDRGWPGYDRWCGYDRWGRYHCTRYSPYVGLDQSHDGTSFTSPDPRVAGVAQKYGISHYAATWIVRATLLAEQDDMTGLHELGLENKDLEKIYEGKKLKPIKMNGLGEKLLMTNEETQRLIEAIAANIEAEKDNN